MFEEIADQEVRLDKWLWAARFFKTRSLAAIAVTGGKVHVNGFRAKPARAVHVGDRLQIRRGAYEWSVIVRALQKQRGPAFQASLLYQETEESARQREATAGQLRAEQAAPRPFKGRPSKKNRRAILRFTRDEV